MFFLNFSLTLSNREQQRFNMLDHVIVHKVSLLKSPKGTFKSPKFLNLPSGKNIRKSTNLNIKLHLIKSLGKKYKT